jgi:hypothetical protein
MAFVEPPHQQLIVRVEHGRVEPWKTKHGYDRRLPHTAHARHQTDKAVQEEAKIGHEKIRGQAGYALIVASEQHRDHQAFEENKVKPEYDKDG